MSRLLFPLSTEIINKIKANIGRLAEAYQRQIFAVEDIGRDPGGRYSIESGSWPKVAAIDLFEKEGAIKKLDNVRFEIVRLDYFDVQSSNVELPVQFSIDDRIATDLKIMGGLYVELYDIENRMRFVLEERLVEMAGPQFLQHLPGKVRKDIEKEKAIPRWHVAETRTRELHYASFSDLVKILEMPGLYQANIARREMIDKLNYLAEVRTRVDHNNLIPDQDVVKTKEYAEQVRRLIPQLKVV